MTNNNSTLPRLDILEGLEKHLRSGNLGHQKWDFSVIILETEYGTCGCAIGLLPFIYPDEFSYIVEEDIIAQIKYCTQITVDNIGVILNFNDEQSQDKLSDIFGNPRLYEVGFYAGVTPLMVADAIKDFIVRYRIRYPQADE